MKARLEVEPWRYFVIEDFLGPPEWNRVREIMSGPEFVDAPKGGRRSIFIYKEPKEGEHIVQPELLRILEKRFQWFIDELGNPQLLREFDHTGPVDVGYKIIVEYNVCGEGFEYPIHTDAPEKLYSLVYYISPEEGDGTRINKPNGTEPEAVVEWKPNSALAFSRTPDTLHSYGSSVQNRRTLNIILTTNDEADLRRIRYQP